MRQNRPGLLEAWRQTSRPQCCQRHDELAEDQLLRQQLLIVLHTTPMHTSQKITEKAATQERTSLPSTSKPPSVSFTSTATASSPTDAVLLARRSLGPIFRARAEATGREDVSSAHGKPCRASSQARSRTWGLCRRSSRICRKVQGTNQWSFNRALGLIWAIRENTS